MSDADHSELIAAAAADADALESFLAQGFSVNARDHHGSTMLHEAAYFGRVDMVRMLLDRGAELDARDGRWDCTPLCFALVGSGERQGDHPDGQWIETVRLLLDAGAERTGIWISGKPPSAAVAAVLAEYGITGETPEEPADPQILRELADRLAQALQAEDLTEFSGLLHPRVRWGTCTSREQVLEWYQAQHSAGVRGRVRETVLDGNRILVNLAVSGLGPDGPDAVCQAFRVKDGQIAEIRGFPTLDEALA